MRILTAEDRGVVRRSLILVLWQEPDFEIAGEAGYGMEVSRSDERRCP